MLLALSAFSAMRASSVTRRMVTRCRLLAISPAFSQGVKMRLAARSVVQHISAMSFRGRAPDLRGGRRKSRLVDFVTKAAANFVRMGEGTEP